MVLPELGEPIKVPALRSDYAIGMGLWQHKVVRRYQLMNRHINANADGWLQAKEEIAQIIANELRLNRKRTHKRVARYQKAGNQNPALDKLPYARARLSKNMSHRLR